MALFFATAFGLPTYVIWQLDRFVSDVSRRMQRRIGTNFALILGEPSREKTTGDCASNGKVSSSTSTVGPKRPAQERVEDKLQCVRFIAQNEGRKI